ncbi:hypothetical protein ABZ892_11730 [Streptomyces sp. NPDC046924]|uniref:hypothetical protein n=1 Tax=Streptomyces sp. NPDC046924 TaxID=3155136 RepID=UPI0033D8D327
MSATTLLGALSRTDHPQTMLRRFLALDAVVTGANGLVYLIDSKPVGSLLGIGSGLLFEPGCTAEMTTVRTPGPMPQRWRAIERAHILSQP